MLTQLLSCQVRPIEFLAKVLDVAFSLCLAISICCEPTTHLCILERLNLVVGLLDVKLDLGLRLLQSALASSKVRHIISDALNGVLVHWSSVRRIHQDAPVMPRMEFWPGDSAFVVVCMSRLPYRDWVARLKCVDEYQVRMLARSSRSGLS